MLLERSLPTEQIYDYTPRPPIAQLPHIMPHRFEEALSSCGKRCILSSLHDCVEPPEGTYFLDRTPKRRIAFQLEQDGEEHAWGLQAQHRVSLMYIFFYHFLIIVGTFGFWAWWLRKHPDDLQNAAVPFITVTIFLSLFWSASGILKSFREPA